MKKENLLIIDDSCAIAGSLAQLLRLVLSDSSVVAEVDFASGKDRMDRVSFTTIILDVSCMVKYAKNQKGTTPSIVLNEIVSKQETARIIFMSGRPVEEVNQMIEGSEEYPFLMKPFSLSTLLEAMNSSANRPPERPEATGSTSLR